MSIPIGIVAAGPSMIFKPHSLEPFASRTVIIHKVRDFTVGGIEQLAESEYVRLE